MTSLSPEVWTAVGLMSIAGVLGFLHVVACIVRNENEMRDLAARISALRAERLARAREVAQSEARVVNIELTGVNAPGSPSADAKPAKK